MEQHGYRKGGHGDVGRAVGVLMDLVNAFEGDGDAPEPKAEAEVVPEVTDEPEAEVAVAPSPRIYAAGARHEIDRDNYLSTEGAVLRGIR